MATKPSEKVVGRPSPFSTPMGTRAAVARSAGRTGGCCTGGVAGRARQGPRGDRARSPAHPPGPPSWPESSGGPPATPASTRNAAAHTRTAAGETDRERKARPVCGVRANDHANEPCSRATAFRKSIRRPPGNVKENRRRSGICPLSDAPSTAQATASACCAMASSSRTGSTSTSADAQGHPRSPGPQHHHAVHLASLVAGLARQRVQRIAQRQPGQSRAGWWAPD